jgi:hypothetical protein
MAWLTVEGPRFDERIGGVDASLRPGTVVKHTIDVGAYQKRKRSATHGACQERRGWCQRVN